MDKMKVGQTSWTPKRTLATQIDQDKLKWTNNRCENENGSRLEPMAREVSPYLVVLCWGRPSRARGQMNENKSRVVLLCQMLIKTKPSGTVAFPRFESTGGHSAIAVNRPSFSSVWICCVRVIQCVDSNDSMILVCVLVFPTLKWIGVVVSLRIGCVVSCCDVQCLPKMLRHLFCKLSSPSRVICLRNVLPVFCIFCVVGDQCLVFFVFVMWCTRVTSVSSLSLHTQRET